MKGYSVHIRAEQKSADILLFGSVGVQIDGTEVANEITRLTSEGITEIHLFINSGGGSVIDGFSIIAANIKSTATIHTHNVGVAASMAASILVSGNVRHSLDFAKMMVHEPSIAGKKIEDTEDENDKKALMALKDSIISHLTQNSTASRKVVTSLVEAETWITAQDAKNKFGFIDKIDKTERKPKSDSEITEDVMLQMAAEYHREPVQFNHDPRKPNYNDPITMKTITDYLQLNENATESVILKAIEKIANDLATKTADLATANTDLETANTTIADQKKSIKGFEDKQTEMNKISVKDAIDAAVKAGKIDKKDEDALNTQFKNNLEGLKMVLDSVKDPAQTIIDQLNISGGSELVPEKQKDWTFREWEQGDGEGLEKIKEVNIELYKKMYKAEYKVEFVA